jgi:DNA-binding SARP family transcriptional activator/Flp pilus assembly protein TadD
MRGGGSGVEFRILGPVELWHGNEQMPLGRAKERSLLGVLALSSGRAVGVRTVVQALWDDQPPLHARKDLQVYVSRLRKQLRDGGSTARIVTQRDTYTFQPGTDVIDYVEFKGLLSVGRAAQREQRLDDAAECLRRAVALWSGQPIAELSTMWMEQRREELENYDLVAGYQALCDIELERGNHREALQYLDDATEGHELDSKYIEQRLCALDGLGHYADLDAYWRQIYRKNVESFGTGPPRELHALYTHLLQERDGLEPGKQTALDSARARPAQLPPLTSDFAGRKDEMTWLDTLLARFRISGSGTPLIVVLTGIPGVGKTEVGLRWAHQIRREFPDGQLYADLNGYTRTGPADPAAILADFLEALGIPRDAVPTTIAARAALLRTLLDDKRVLIVLDDARDSNQIRPLLPASPHCVLLVTSRHRLPDLVSRYGAYRHVVPPLPPAESGTLLGHVLDAAGVAYTNDSIAAMTAVSGGLPRAIRAITDLAIPSGALEAADVLTVGEDEFQTVRASFTWSYDVLSSETARLFRLVSLHPGPDFTSAAAAVLVALSQEQVRRALTTLMNLNMVEGFNERFQFHRLVHAFARAQSEQVDSVEEHEAALRRLVGWYLDQVELPTDVAWIDIERENIAAVTELAVSRQWPHAWKILRALRAHIQREYPPNDWMHVHAAALAVTRETRDLDGEAAVLLGLAIVHRTTGDDSAARRALHEALGALRKTNDQRGQVEVLNLLAENHARDGNTASAVAMAVEALALPECDLHADSYLRLGIAYAHEGRFDDATASLVEARNLFERHQNRRGHLLVLTEMALISRRRGEIDKAITLLTQVVTPNTENIVQRRHALSALVNLSELCCDENRYENAHTYAREAIGLCHPSQDIHYMVRAVVVRVRALTATGSRTTAETEARKLIEILADVTDPAGPKALRQLAALDLHNHGI